MVLSLVHPRCSRKRLGSHIMMKFGVLFSSSRILWTKRPCALFSSFGMFWKKNLTSYSGVLFSSSRILWKKRPCALFSSFGIFWKKEFDLILWWFLVFSLPHPMCSRKRFWPHIVMDCSDLFSSSSMFYRKRYCALLNSFEIFWRRPSWPHIVMTCAVLFSSSRIFWKRLWLHIVITCGAPLCPSRWLCKIHVLCLWTIERGIGAVIIFDKCTAQFWRLWWLVNA